MQTLEAENASLRAEVAEHDGVLAVWRGRLERAEAEVARLRAELQNTVTTAYHDGIVHDAVAERVRAVREAEERGLAWADNYHGREEDTALAAWRQTQEEGQ